MRTAAFSASAGSKERTAIALLATFSDLVSFQANANSVAFTVCELNASLFQGVLYS